MHVEPRNGASIDRIYLHTNEGPEQPGGASGLANYLLNNGSDGGGYHYVVGDVGVRIAEDDTIVWGAGGDNTHSLHLVFEGFAAQTPEQWKDAFSTKEIGLAVMVVASWCKMHNIPPEKFAPAAPGQAPTGRGIGEHAYDHAPSSDGHSDPGFGFPIDGFIALVAAQVNPPIDWNALKVLADWKTETSVNELRQGEMGWRVTTLKQLLAQQGYSVDNESPFYGDKLVVQVAKFKADHKLSNHDGSAFGKEAVAALLP